MKYGIFALSIVLLIVVSACTPSDPTVGKVLEKQSLACSFSVESQFGGTQKLFVVFDDTWLIFEAADTMGEPGGFKYYLAENAFIPGKDLLSDLGDSADGCDFVELDDPDTPLSYGSFLDMLDSQSADDESARDMRGLLLERDARLSELAERYPSLKELSCEPVERISLDGKVCLLSEFDLW